MSVWSLAKAPPHKSTVTHPPDCIAEAPPHLVAVTQSRRPTKPPLPTRPC